jgi:hypothetical protein
LKTSGTATCGDRHLTAPPFFGRLTDRGVGIAWNATGTPCAYEHRALSLPPHHGNVTGQESGARSKRDGWPRHWGSGPHVSAS